VASITCFCISNLVRNTAVTQFEIIKDFLKYMPDLYKIPNDEIKENVLRVWRDYACLENEVLPSILPLIPIEEIIELIDKNSTSLLNQALSIIINIVSANGELLDKSLKIKILHSIQNLFLTDISDESYSNACDIINNLYVDIILNKKIIYESNVIHALCKCITQNYKLDINVFIYI